MDSKIAASTQELEDLEERTAAIENEIKALEQKILEIGGSRLLAQRSKVDGIRLHLQLATDEITKAEVAKAKAEKDLAKLEKSLRANGESCELVEADLETLQTELNECEAYVHELQATVEDAQIKEEGQKEDLDRLQKQLDEVNEKVQGFRQKQVSKSHSHCCCYTGS